MELFERFRLHLEIGFSGDGLVSTHLSKGFLLKGNNKTTNSVALCGTVRQPSFKEGKVNAFATEMKLIINKQHDYVFM